MFEDQFAERVWVEVNVQPGGEREVLLMIETELSLNPQEKNFEPAHFNSLTAAVDAYIASSKHYDRAVILPFNKPKSDSDGWKVKFENPFDIRIRSQKSSTTFQ